jgi:hypothetical protein
MKKQQKQTITPHKYGSFSGNQGQNVTLGLEKKCSIGNL